MGFRVKFHQRRAIVAAALIATGVPVPAVAQPAEKPAPEAAAPTVQPSNAAYMQPMSRLATILGSMHFLRTICGDADAAVWRQRMTDLLDAQAPNEADRRILVASFNQGYRSFAATYRKCTPSATVAVERYRREGANLSREISARYGN
jgi:uncharacterized protein (TIGR02301 family)